MKEWTNKSNAPLYSKMPIDIFRKIAEDCGLSNGCDVTLLSPYIRKSNAILEVGAGYGRVISHITKDAFSGSLYALEREKKLCEHLKSNSFRNTEIINDDLLSFTTNLKFDLILWMWTGLCEFSKNEQSAVLKKLTSFLNTNGLLALDLIPPEREPTNASMFGAGSYMITTPYGKDYGYFPTCDEVNLYAKESNVQEIEKIKYKTSTNHSRVIYIFKK